MLKILNVELLLKWTVCCKIDNKGIVHTEI